MEDITLSVATRQAIEKSTGLSYASLIENDATSIDRAIEQNIGAPLHFNLEKDPRIHSRGSVFLALRRFIFRKNIEKQSDRITR